MAFHTISEAINSYAEQMTTPESEVLAKLNRQTNLKVPLPIMLSGHLQGAVLTMISQMVHPKAILEIGTYTGYSAICLAQGLAEGGIIDTIDHNEELEDFCKQYWEEAGVLDKINPLIGAADFVIPKLDKTYDLVFIDADKVNYAHYFDLVVDKVRKGGWIIADNVLYDGEVVMPEADQSKNGKAIHAYNQKVAADTRVEQVLLPIRDGLLVARKL